MMVTPKPVTLRPRMVGMTVIKGPEAATSGVASQEALGHSCSHRCREFRCFFPFAVT